MPANKIFIRCRKCRTPVVSVSLKKGYGDLDISEVVRVKQDQEADFICSKCKLIEKKPKPETIHSDYRHTKKGSCAVVDDIMNLFRMGD